VNCAYSAVSRIPLKVFSWRFIYSIVYACATNS